MELIETVRGMLSPVVDVDFFLSGKAGDSAVSKDAIAIAIKGTNYAKVQARLKDFDDRSCQVLNDLNSRKQQAISDYESACAKANREKPGGKPSGSDWEAVDKYNNQVDLYHRCLDRARQLEATAQDAERKLDDERQRRTEERHKRMEELEPAFDQDIVSFFEKIYQLAYDNEHSKQRYFEAFVAITLARRSYATLYDRVNGGTERKQINDTFTKIDAIMADLVTNHEDALKTALTSVGAHIKSSLDANQKILDEINTDLKTLPYKACADNEPSLSALAGISVVTDFTYKNIIDPALLTQTEQQVCRRKADMEKQISDIAEAQKMNGAIFDAIETVQNASSARLEQMRANWIQQMAGHVIETRFVLSVFDESVQDEYLRKHKAWLKSVDDAMGKQLGFDSVKSLFEKCVSSELLAVTTNTILLKNQALIFGAYRRGLADKKAELERGVTTLGVTLDGINRLPKEKAEAFQRKISYLFIAALIPGVNIIILFVIGSMIGEYLSALKSANASYAKLRKLLIQRFLIFYIIHAVAALACVGISFATKQDMRTFWHVISGLYAVSCAAFVLRNLQMTKLDSGENTKGKLIKDRPIPK